jgi:hypothetical protein
VLNTDGMGGGYQRMGKFYRSGCFLRGGNSTSMGRFIPDSGEAGSQVSL